MKLCKCMIANLSELLQDKCYLALDEIRDVLQNEAISDNNKLNYIIFILEQRLDI